MELKQATEATSYSEVLKNALRLYESVISEYEAGNRIYIREASGDLKEYKIFLWTPASNLALLQ